MLGNLRSFYLSSFQEIYHKPNLWKSFITIGHTAHFLKENSENYMFSSFICYKKLQ